MQTLEDIRTYAQALPEVEEKPHFGRPAFRVRDRLFVSVHLEAEDHSAIVHIGEVEAASAVAQDPDAHEEVWREHGGERIFVGLRVDLPQVSADRLRELIEAAWRHRAPKRLVATYDGES